MAVGASADCGRCDGLLYFHVARTGAVARRRSYRLRGAHMDILRSVHAQLHHSVYRDILLQEHAAAENAVSYRNPIPYSRDMRRSGIRVLFLPAGFRQLVVAHHRAVPCNRGRYTGI